MSRRKGFRDSRTENANCGFTLIELLVAISVIAVLISILVPSLSRAREQGNKVVCMSNMKEIGNAIASYLTENNNLPWTYVQPEGSDPKITISSSYTWGGMMASRPFPGDETGDWAVVPPELRPLNRYIDPTARTRDAIKVVKCPGDRSAVSPDISDPDQRPLELEGLRSSWEAFGTSYSINWLFMEDPAITDPFSIDRLMYYGKTFVQEAVGGSAAEMAVIWENQVDQLLNNATDTGGGRLGEGWHRTFSCHSFLFMDGHMEYGYFDTRFCRGPGWRIWRK
ncbi:MAG TPA: type II secretion system protein [Phycisphaerae bacterium]|nr:type II secretion system protein [Phycisphaerae bacterium]